MTAINVLDCVEVEHPRWVYALVKCVPLSPADLPLEGKTVLLVDGDNRGPLGVTLQCLIERSGMVCLKSNWTSGGLKNLVSFPPRSIIILFANFAPLKCGLSSVSSMVMLKE